MPVLILGLLIFLGIHSLRIFADDWRNRQRARFGELGWKGIYSLISIIGLVLIVYGFGLARQHPVPLYVPPLWLRHLNALFALLAFVLVAAAYIPRNHLKAKFGHPMLLGVKIWAVGHLLATGMLHDVLLFGAFLLWAVLLFIVSRRRDRAAGAVYPAGTLAGDLLALVIGIAGWAVFALWLHLALIGVNPMA
ncbi:NnrU family protein [Rhodanobacter thiooxydans]|uniref:NnrU family protein n=1 Tax=Rhodanobacter thiooxydans TaxID=416169 RepID=A0A154QGH7_9GAMM|nr:NnrU family protein [Rhodanobacter thiooxydans]EIM02713.1 NnrU family protein [Rhodanobacter thiooxydans LCS2]KZC23287.1 NnrU family protein [Rhodanobacter thiooxydans]